MRKLLRHYFVNTFALFMVTQVISGLEFEKGMETVLLAGVGITAASILAKPIINLLLLPINLVTFGLFRWVGSAIALYVVTLVIPGFKVAGFVFNGLTGKWFELPAISLGGGILAFIAFSFVISFFTSFVYWLIKG